MAKNNESAEIRKWAKENNIEVGARGRISKDVEDKYFAAKLNEIAAKAFMGQEEG